MRKLLFGAVATAIVALQPSIALAQREVIKNIPGSTSPITRSFGPFPILQTIPVTASAAGLVGLPSGVQATNICIGGTATGVGAGPTGYQPITFVGNVLCLDAGPNGDFITFANNCPAGTTPVIQGIKVIKTPFRIPKCPDVFPGGAQVVLTPDFDGGVRTFFPLKFEPCNTTIALQIEFACVSPAGANRGKVVEVHVNTFTFRVTITPDTLSWVVEAIHVEPLGVCETPCITDEGLYLQLLTLANNIKTAAAGGQATIIALNNALDIFEATVVRNALFVTSVAQVTVTNGVITAINPCGAVFPAGVPGNSTITSFGFGIVDSLENPCACKLIADIFCLKAALIGTDP